MVGGGGAAVAAVGGEGGGGIVEVGGEAGEDEMAGGVAGVEVGWGGIAEGADLRWLVPDSQAMAGEGRYQESPTGLKYFVLHSGCWGSIVKGG